MRKWPVATIGGLVGLTIGAAGAWALADSLTMRPAWPSSAFDLAIRAYDSCGQSGRDCHAKGAYVPTEQHAACRRNLYLSQTRINGDGADFWFRCRYGRSVGEYFVEVSPGGGRGEAGGVYYAFLPATSNLPFGSAVGDSQARPENLGRKPAAG